MCDDDYLKDAVLVVSDRHGIYCPKIMAEMLAPDHVIGLRDAAETLAILSSGPDHAEYWETWDELLSNATIVGKHGDGTETHYRVHQDGDVWLVPYAQ